MECSCGHSIERSTGDSMEHSSRSSERSSRSIEYSLLIP